MFGGKLRQSQVDGLNLLLKETSGLPVEFRAYLMATAFHETEQTMQPVRETLASTDQKAVNILNRDFDAGKLSSVSRPYWDFDQEGKTWLGRGYVQLTHKTNYIRASKLTGIDLVADPSKAMNPATAATILVKGSIDGLFTGKSLNDYLPGDYVGARRVINGRDRAQKIARYAETFEKALKETPPKKPRKKRSVFRWLLRSA